VCSRDSGDRYKFKPGYVLIQGLELRNAAPPHGFTDGAGKARKYMRNAAAIFVERGEHVVIRNCTVHSSGNGIFVASGRDAPSLSRDITIEGSYIHGNGNVGSDRQHNAYTEAAGMVFQYNRFGPPRAGSRPTTTSAATCSSAR